MKSLIWFRRDLRLEDNRTFEQASGEVLPLFIFDSHLLSPLPKEDRRVGYIYGEVMRLKSELRARGLDLAIFYGEPLKILSRLKEQGFSRLFASQDYDSYALSRDKTARELLDCRFVLDNYLFDPNEVLKKEGSPYTIFSAYYNQSLKILSEGHYAKGLDLPKKLAPYPIPAPPSLESMGFSPLPLLESLKILPQKRLEEFSSKITRYALDRDSLEAEATSGLSLFLRFGTLGVREVIRRLKAWQEEGIKVAPFYRQILWREFYAMLLYHFPHSEREDFKPMQMRWSESQERLERWQRGECGVPLVDAGMRELNHTGFMHNRARMVCASFLTKNLHLHWSWGERYFASKLLDYDVAQNVGNWQWCAGSGADAQPFFRIFNPYTQSLKFDPKGEYVKRWIPELRGISTQNWSSEERWEGLKERYLAPIVSAKRSAQEAKAMQNTLHVSS